jgi:hypothetical protein
VTVTSGAAAPPEDPRPDRLLAAESIGMALVGIRVVAKTVVVYSWDARAARLRWLAKQKPTKPA